MAKDGAGGAGPLLSGAAKAGGLALGVAVALNFWNSHYTTNVAVPPRLWLADGALRERVLPHCSALHRPFSPTPWASNQHAQTVLGLMRTLTIRNHYNRQLILTVDGATLGLDWFDCCDSPTYRSPASASPSASTTATVAAAAADAHATAVSTNSSTNSGVGKASGSGTGGGGGGPLSPTAPVLLVCHGINGGSHEGYVKWACAAAVARGWRAVVLNYRGCNGLPFTAPRGYAATLSHDVFTAVYSVRARFPSAPVVAVGYSLGGLKLTKYLGEADAGLHVPPPGLPRLFAGSGLAAAAVVSSPVSLWHSSANLSDRSSLNFLYNLAVAYKLREHLAHHKADIESLTRFDVDAALAQWTVAGIEDNGLPASFGFASRQHYYEAASSLDYIPAITTPTLMLMAEDDPFLGVVPDAECARNPNTLLALTRRGGHVAFLQGAWPLGVAYMDEAVMEFFDATLQRLHDSAAQDSMHHNYNRRQQLAAEQQGHAHAGHQAEEKAADKQAAEQRKGKVKGSKAAAARVAVTDAARAGASAAALAAASRSCPSPCCAGAAWWAPGAAAAAGGESGGAGRSKRFDPAAASAAATAAAAAAAATAAAAMAAAQAAKAEQRAAQVRLLAHLQQQQAEQRVLASLAEAAGLSGKEAAAAAVSAMAHAGRPRSKL